MCVTIYIKYFRGLVEVGGEEVSFIKKKVLRWYGTSVDVNVDKSKL